MAMQRFLILLTVLVFSLLANHAGMNNGQIVYSSPPPPSVICTSCATCENPCAPVVPASPPPPSPPPPAAAQNAECPPPPDTYVYPYSPPSRPGSQYPYYPYYTISHSAPLVNYGSALFFLVSPLLLILSLLWAASSGIVHSRSFSPLCFRVSRHHHQMGKSQFKLSFHCCWLLLVYDLEFLRSAMPFLKQLR